jgi:hypothetical protein
MVRENVLPVLLWRRIAVDDGDNILSVLLWRGGAVDDGDIFCQCCCGAGEQLMTATTFWQ